MNKAEGKDLTKRLRIAARNFNSGTEDLRPLLLLASRRIESLEQERGFDRLTIEGYVGIETELVDALSRLTEEELQPCMPPCPGHLGEKALALIREARSQWDCLATEAAGAERERIRQLALAGTEWLEPSDFVPPRASSREGDLWRRAQAVARREFAEEIDDQATKEGGDS